MTKRRMLSSVPVEVTAEQWDRMVDHLLIAGYSVTIHDNGDSVWIVTDQHPSNDVCIGTRNSGGCWVYPANFARFAYQ